jgi:hypothetical protein
VDTAAAADFSRIRSWKANTVRIELAQYYLVNKSRFYDPTYAERVDRVVKQARAAGLQVIIALQHSDRGDPNYANFSPTSQTNMHQPMADRAHSIPFWQELAARYKGDGGIIYELYSEPFPIGGPGGFSNWELWQNGGTHPADNVYEPRAAFQAVGMQELYDVVRATGAHNLVIVNGTQWGYNLEQIPARRVKGYNIAYGTHPWGDPEQTTRQPSTWEKEWMFLAATDPVMVTEFGEFETCRVEYARAVLDQADRLGISWIAWAWQAPGAADSKEQVRGAPICEFPMLLSDWGGTPTRLGQVVKDRLASY